MTTDELDRLLASRDDIVPSAGFTDAVMAAVRHEDWRTPPLRFPWQRAALGPLMAVLLLAVASWFFTPAAIGTALVGSLGMLEVITAVAEGASSAAWWRMALALWVTLASVALSGHLAARVERHG
jgi:hypothetical protein